MSPRSTPEQIIKDYIGRDENRYDPEMLPLNGSYPLLVTLGIEIKGVLDVDLVDGTM